MRTFREAILLAAQRIEDTSAAFRFEAIYTPDPDDPRAEGCAMGWITAYLGCGGAYYQAGYLMDLPPDERWDPIHTFYDRLDTICTSLYGYKSKHSWMLVSLVCAQCLRMYADTYYPEVVEVRKAA